MRTYLVLSVAFLFLYGCSRHQSRISGTLLGADGRPMAMARARLTDAAGHRVLPAETEKDLLYVHVDSSGKFDCSTDLTGAFVLILTGDGHRQLEIPLLMTEGVDVGIQARLGTRSMLPIGDSAEIVYDLDRETDSVIPMELQEQGIWKFDDPASLQARFVEKAARFNGWVVQFESDRRAFVLAGNTFWSFVGSWAAQVDTLSYDLKIESDGVIRDELEMELLEIALISPMAVDHERLRRCLNEIAPASPVWEYHNRLALHAGAFHPAGAAYLGTIMEQSPSREFRAYLVYSQLQDAFLRRDTVDQGRLTDRLLGEFAGTRASRSAFPALQPRMSPR